MDYKLQLWIQKWPGLYSDCHLIPDKAAAAAADPNAAWAAYYSHYYQQPPGPVPGAPPAPTAPPVQGEPPQPPPSGQSDYTKAWEEYYKKLGNSTGASLLVEKSINGLIARLIGNDLI